MLIHLLILDVFFLFLLSYWEQKSVYLSVWFMQIFDVHKAGNMCFVLFLD